MEVWLWEYLDVNKENYVVEGIWEGGLFLFSFIIFFINFSYQWRKDYVTGNFIIFFGIFLEIRKDV